MSVTINVFDGKPTGRQSVAAKPTSMATQPRKAVRVKPVSTATPGAAKRATTVPAKPAQLSKSAKRKRAFKESAKVALIPGYGISKLFKRRKRR